MRASTFLLLTFVTMTFGLTPAHAQVKVRAQVPSGVKPTWHQGIRRINAESYWNAVACGKLGGEQSPCVFFDTGLCKNGDFTLALFTPYKQVAYQVWRAVLQKQPVPTPNYQNAERAQVTVGITPVKGANNPITTIVIKRDGKTVKPTTQTLDAGGGQFTFEPAAFAATSDITIEFIGKARTISCFVEEPVLERFR